MATVDYIFNTARRAGFAPQPTWNILDFGCGQGELVCSLRERGYTAYGFDIYNSLGSHCQDKPWFSFSDSKRHGFKLEETFSMPYESNSFDMIISQEVLEHVMDPEPVLCEIARVLRPGGVSINLYPPRFCPVEGHINVPYGHLIVHRWYYRFWARLGIRNAVQKNTSMTADEVAAANEHYIRAYTRYPENSLMLRLGKKYFSSAYFDQYASLTAFMEHLEERLAHYSMWYGTRLAVRTVRAVTRTKTGDGVWRWLCRDCAPTRYVLENVIPSVCLILRK